MGDGSDQLESEPDKEVQRLVRLAAFLRRSARRNRLSDERNPLSWFLGGNTLAGCNAAADLFSWGDPSALTPKGRIS